MAMALLLLPALGLCSVGGAFTACVPDRWGADCSGECSCEPHEDCNQGVSGDGACTCALGYEKLCGIPSRLVPKLADPPSCPADEQGHVQCSLTQIQFEPVAWRRLRVDADTHQAPRHIANATLAPILPTALLASALRLVGYDRQVSQLLGIDPQAASASSQRFKEYFSGRVLFPGSLPYSHVYGGHQFGAWRGQLGDVSHELSPPQLDAKG